MNFQNKIALVTGSGRGIGKAIALHFAREGAAVIVNFFRNRAPAEETAEEIRGQTIIFDGGHSLTFGKQTAS